MSLLFKLFQRRKLCKSFWVIKWLYVKSCYFLIISKLFLCRNSFSNLQNLIVLCNFEICNPRLQNSTLLLSRGSVLRPDIPQGTAFQAPIVDSFFFASPTAKILQTLVHIYFLLNNFLTQAVSVCITPGWADLPQLLAAKLAKLGTTH